MSRDNYERPDCLSALLDGEKIFLAAGVGVRFFASCLSVVLSHLTQVVC